jgi:integrase
MLRRRKDGNYFADIRVGGERIRRTLGTKNKAVATRLYKNLATELASDTADSEAEQLKEATSNFKWEHAVVAWLEDPEVLQKRSLDRDKELLQGLDPFLRGKLLTEITYRSLLPVQQAFKQRKLAPATVNHYMGMVRSVLKRAEKKWGWLTTVPSIPWLETNNEVIRYLTKDEEVRLLAALPEHLRVASLIALHTGMRSKEIREMRWAWVNFEEGHVTIPVEFSKNKQPMRKALNKTVMAVIRDQIGKNRQFVVTYQGERIRTAFTTRAWYLALEAAGIENFRFHDFRHTWASRLRQKGVPLDVLQDMGGWKSHLMVRRYGHLDVSHTQGYAALLEEDSEVVQAENVVRLTVPKKAAN